MKSLAYAHTVLNREISCAARRAEALAIVEAWVNDLADALPNREQFIAMPLKEKLCGIMVLARMVDDVSMGSLAKVMLTSIERYEDSSYAHTH